MAYKHPEVVREFRGNYDFLSNFYPCCFEWERVLWPASENAYQGAKCIKFSVRKIIAKLTPEEAKTLGRVVVMRPGFEDIKIDIMASILRKKFAPGTHLAQMLVDTGDAHLQKGNGWGDTFWGVDLMTSRGRNNLGHILMNIREELRNG